MTPFRASCPFRQRTHAGIQRTRSESGMHYGVLKAARSRPVLLTVGLLVVLLVVAGLATSGLPGGLVMAGLALLLLGAGAVIVGRARWAFIAGRKVATVIAAAGLVALTVGGVTAPPTP